MNNFVSDQLHVAQQSRREKLRVQHFSSSRDGPRIDDYSSGFEVVQSSFNNTDLDQVGDINMRGNANILYDPVVLGCSSAMPNFSENQGPCDMKTRVESNLENCRVWNSVSSSRGTVSDLSAFEMKAKLNSTRHRQSQYQHGDMNSFANQLQHQNVFSDGVTTAVLGMQPNCNPQGNACVSWRSYGGDNELQVPIASYGYEQSDGAQLLSGSSWNAEMVGSYSKGLSLSLCSYPAGSMITSSDQFTNSDHIPQSIPLHNGARVAFQDSEPCSLISVVRTSAIGQGTSILESVEPLTGYHRQTGPLGPFTGYATILKNSRFLKPAQQLLDEYCLVIEKLANNSTRVVSDNVLDNSGDLATAVNSIVTDVVTTGDQTIGSSTATKSPSESYRPDYQAKNAKLSYMLEEVSFYAYLHLYSPSCVVNKN